MGTLEVVGYSDGAEENFTRILEKKVCVCVCLWVRIVIFLVHISIV